MSKNICTKAVLTLLALGLCSSSEAVRIRYPDSVTDLAVDIARANTNHENDIIDLQGRTFFIETVNNTSANGANGLPVVQPDLGVATPHTLTIRNGAIEISLLSGLSARHFEVALGATLYLENVKLKYGSSVASGAIVGDGGSVYNGGFLGTRHVAFISNSAGGNGGAIYNNGSCSIISTTFNQNTAVGTDFAPILAFLKRTLALQAAVAQFSIMQLSRRFSIQLLLITQAQKMAELSFLIEAPAS